MTGLDDAALLAVVAIGSALGASALAQASWPRRSPAAAILLWQALGLASGLAAVGTLIGLAMPASTIGLVRSVLRAGALLRTGESVPGDRHVRRGGRHADDRGRASGWPAWPPGWSCSRRCAGCWSPRRPRRCRPGGGSGPCSRCSPTATRRCPARSSSTTPPRPRTACPGCDRRSWSASAPWNCSAAASWRPCSRTSGPTCASVTTSCCCRSPRCGAPSPSPPPAPTPIARWRCWSRCSPTTARCGPARRASWCPPWCGSAPRAPARRPRARWPPAEGEVAARVTRLLQPVRPLPTAAVLAICLAAALLVAAPVTLLII